MVILGAGFGGLELATTLSEALGDEIAVSLIDKSDAFVFGFAKLDVMFGRTAPEAVRMPYQEIAKAGVQFRQETVTAIDPDARRVTTEAGSYEADVLVIALGADYDMDATPGLAEGANEFYSVAGANILRDVLPAFSGGRVVVGVCGAPFKCPPAPSECALMLHDYFLARGIREDCDLKLVMPLRNSGAALARHLARPARCVRRARHRVRREAGASSSIDPARKVAVLDDDSELPFDLFLGVPKHRAPDVVIASGMTENGYVPVESRTLATRYPGVYALGDCATRGRPEGGRLRGARRAGVVAESADRGAAGAAGARGLRRPRLLLHRVRARPHRARRHRLPLGPEADRRLPGAIGGARRGEAALRLEPQGALVRRRVARHRRFTLCV